MHRFGKPLCRIPEGTTVKVEDLDACRAARAKLYAMGLTPGTVLEVVSSGPGPCRLRVRGTDLVLGRGLSEKVIACPLGECPKGQCPGLALLPEDDQD
ncbi:MAG: ferrous iron transport protein A [Desulfovibrionaceae bacterium]